MVLSMWKFTGVILAALMAIAGLQKAKAEELQFEPAGAAGVAVVVVVVGGVCVYFLVKTCQRLFPKTPAPSTNSPPEFIGGGVDTAGSWSYYGVVSCYEPQTEQQWPTITMELSGVIQENEHGPYFHLAASRRLDGAEVLQDYDSFQADLARHGITMGPVGTMYYGRNGKPAYEEEVPIRFSESGTEHLVTINSEAGPSIPLVIQRSFDLQTWNNFGYVSVPMGQQFKLVDTTTRQSAFYRIQPR